ncbi:TrbC family F-type conjugative pilus assembly protein [Methylovulum miyakonense]|uniref:TrbC family F-type conjugative pilus assembly protein n=1 Tax=Methylovulum miyakonense TaxID=645578 RepID=UPI00039BE005|nr:TrbC family F-type conjugative pilus assembly protein [Methylovulum miyakonense]
MLLSILIGHSAAHAEEDWLTRSQTILNDLEGQPRPSWLDSNPHHPDAQRQALDIINGSKLIALKAMSHPSKPTSEVQPEKPLRVVFISFSLGESVLKGIFEEASGQDDVLLVLRGPKPKQKLTGLFAELKALLKDIEPLPNIVIDPTRFQKWGVATVPEIVVEDQGKARLRVKGVTSLGWLKSRQAAGRQGDLGQFGEVYQIAEIDLLEAIKHRLAAMDWPRKQQQAIARFWGQRRFEVLPVAQEDRDREVDLTVTAPRDLITPNGQLIIRAGQTVNPLDKLAFGLCLIIFDATEQTQIAIARQLSCRDKNARVLYLVTQLSRQDGWDGLKTLENSLQSPVYLLTPDVRQRFQLQQVPALVEQSGNRVVVRERKVAMPAANHQPTAAGG